MPVGLRLAAALMIFGLIAGAVVFRLGEVWLAVGCGLATGYFLAHLADWIRQHRPAWKPEWLLVIPFIGFPIGLILLNAFIGVFSVAALFLLQLDFIVYHARSATRGRPGSL